MESVLFLDACMRGPQLSRTYGLCQHFLDRYTTCHPQVIIQHRDLLHSQLPLLTGELAAQREQWVAEEKEQPLLAPAREVAGADLIVVGAPFWDLSFPAALKAYLEWASVLGITFCYTPEGQQVGLSRARSLVYVTTAGGPVEGQNYGYDYVKALSKMFGISDCRCVVAQGLDIRGADVQAILRGAEGELETLAAQL